jgi:hypothetical protein
MLVYPRAKNENAANRHDPSAPWGRPVLMVGGVARCVGARHWTPGSHRAEALGNTIARSVPNRFLVGNVIVFRLLVDFRPKDFDQFKR